MCVHRLYWKCSLCCFRIHFSLFPLYQLLLLFLRCYLLHNKPFIFVLYINLTYCHSWQRSYLFILHTFIHHDQEKQGWYRHLSGKKNKTNIPILYFFVLRPHITFIRLYCFIRQIALQIRYPRALSGVFTCEVFLFSFRVGSTVLFSFVSRK